MFLGIDERYETLSIYVDIHPYISRAHLTPRVPMIAIVSYSHGLQQTLRFLLFNWFCNLNIRCLDYEISNLVWCLFQARQVRRLWMMKMKRRRMTTTRAMTKPPTLMKPCKFSLNSPGLQEHLQDIDNNSSNCETSDSDEAMQVLT